MYRPEPQTRRGSSRAGPGSSQEPGPSRDPWLSQRQAFHDAANWLTILLGHLEMMRDEPDSPRHLELARRAARAAHRLCALPPSSSRPSDSLDAARHAHRVLDHLAPAASARGVCLELDAGEVPPVAADAPGFDDAVLNLVRNALEAVGDGGRIVLRIEAAGDDFVRIRVDDDGPGVPAALRDALARPGVSSRAGTDRGLGLSRVADWLAQRGARLEVGDAAPGGGASIGFVLPAAPDSSSARERDRSGTLRILLVEDDVAVAEVLSLLLSSDGHQVVHRADAHGAVERFAPGAFDLALCDQNLPDGTGEELVGLLRGRDPDLGCFLVTGAPESVHCPDDPRCGVLAKPVSRDDLRRAVARVVRSSNPGTPRGEA